MLSKRIALIIWTSSVSAMSGIQMDPGGGGNGIMFTDIPGAGIYNSINHALLQIPGSSQIRGKTIDNSYYRPGAQSGVTTHGVNLLSGQPSYQVPIGSISAGGEIGFSITFGYGGEIRQQYDSDNDRGPTSWIGLGWNFGIPFVAINHRGTVSYSDDVVYCNLGQYGGGQILQNESTKKYFVSGDPTITVNPTYDANGFIVDWEFITSGGVRLIFGRNDNNNDSKRTILKTGDMLWVSPYTYASASDFIYRWDVSTISDYQGKNRLIFTYAQTRKLIGGSKYFSQESYVKNIISKNAANVEIERFTFNTVGKQTGVEYVVPSQEDIQGQKLFETKRLDNIQHFSEGVLDRSWYLTQPLLTSDPIGNTLPYPKARLTKIQVQIPNPRGGILTDPKWDWRFDYDDNANRHSGLKTIYKPGSGRDVYTYGRPDYNFSYTSQGGALVYPWKDLTRQKASIVSFNSAPLPTNFDQTIWKNNTVCSEEFCWLILERNELPNASTGPNGEDRFEMQVFKNSGNQFVPVAMGDPSVADNFDHWDVSVVNDFQIIPMGKDLLIVQPRSKRLTVWEWNGVNFDAKPILLNRNFAGGTSALVPINADYQSTWEVKVVGNYILIHDDKYIDGCTRGAAVPKSKVYLLSKVGGVWKDINENECTDPSPSANRICALDNKPLGGLSAYGETFKSTIGCMEFDAQKLHISATSNMFHIIDDNTDIIFTYAVNSAGTGFNLISDKYPVIAAVQKSGFSMNWDHHISAPIMFGNDYFLIKSGISGNSRYDIMHYTGQSIVLVGTVPEVADAAGDLQYGSTLNAWMGGDYFLVTDQVAGKADAYYKKVSIDGSGNATGISFVKVAIRSDVPLAAAGDIVARTSQSAFTLEYYPDQKATGGIPTAPPLFDASNNYRTFLYVTDPSLHGAGSYHQLYSPTGKFQDVNNRNYYDLTFSYADNLIIAKSGVATSGSGPCTSAATCSENFITATTLAGPSGLANKFIRKKNLVFNAWPGGISSLSVKTISPAARLACVGVLNNTTHRAEFSLLKSMGEGFTSTPYEMGTAPALSGDINFVKTFSTIGDLSSYSGENWEMNTDYQFSYTPDAGDIDRLPQYNCQTQSFVIPSAMVVQFDKSDNSTLDPGKGIKAETYFHIVDETASQLSDNDILLSGLVKSQTSHRVNSLVGSYSLGGLISTQSNTYYPPSSQAGWPATLRMTRPLSQTSVTYAANGSSQTNSTSYHGYYGPANTALFTKSKVGSVWYLSQALFSSTGTNKTQPFGSRGYRLTTEPLDATLDAWNSPNVPYDQGDALLQGVSANQVTFDAGYPYKVKSKLIWNATDNSLSDEELKIGVNPLFSLSDGYQTVQRIDRRNLNGQVIEAASILSENKGIERHTVSFYEGPASLPVGHVDNALYDEAAILTAENGPIAGMSTFDLDGRWSRGNSGETSVQAHTGRYSIKIVDNNAGPSVDLKLRTSFPQGYEYIVSAWIYGENASPPTLIAERFRTGGFFVQTLRNIQTPISGTYSSGKWQRYEMRIPAAELIGNENLFVGGAGDFLRVRFAAGGTGNVIYADDIVCRPNISSFGLTAYNGKGQVTSSTNQDHILTFFEYDILGNRTGIRDDVNRIFSSSATHMPGEND